MFYVFRYIIAKKQSKDEKHFAGDKFSAFMYNTVVGMVFYPE